jgi:hypothetical protein
VGVLGVDTVVVVGAEVITEVMALLSESPIDFVNIRPTDSGFCGAALPIKGL